MDACGREVMSEIVYGRDPTIGKGAAMADNPNYMDDLSAEDQARIENEIRRVRRTMIAAARRRMARSAKAPPTKDERRILWLDARFVWDLLGRYAAGESLHSLGKEMGYAGGETLHWKFRKLTSSVGEEIVDEHGWVVAIDIGGKRYSYDDWERMPPRRWAIIAIDALAKSGRQPFVPWDENGRYKQA